MVIVTVAPLDPPLPPGGFVGDVGAP